MKIAELKDKNFGVDIDLKVIFDETQQKEMWGRQVKSVVVVDADATDSETTAWLDLYDDDIEKYKFQDKLRAVNCYAKKITTKKGEQMLITYGYKDKKLVGKYEKIEVE